MPSPQLIIISGPPGTGKTSLGLRLAADLQLPFIHKDGVKEKLFDSLGWSDREWSKKLGRASYDLLYYFVETLMAAGCSQIVEANFPPDFATATFQALQQKHDFAPFQIQCRAEGTVLLERYIARANSGIRHPGHVEHILQEELKPVLLKGYLEPLNLDGPLYQLDTTDFAKIDYPALISAIQSQG